MVIYRTLELELVGPWLVRSSVRRPSVVRSGTIIGIPLSSCSIESEQGVH
jgi:hypothetical protein